NGRPMRGPSTAAPTCTRWGRSSVSASPAAPPSQAATVLDTLDQVRHREPVPVRQLRPGVPRDLETICLKCLAKEPWHRYATARELADDLGACTSGYYPRGLGCSVAGTTRHGNGVRLYRPR